jgi:hypothetical protein
VAGQTPIARNSVRGLFTRHQTRTVTAMSPATCGPWLAHGPRTRHFH